MSMRYPGGLIATTPVNQQYPSGVWTGPQVTPYQTNNVWGNDTSFKNTTMLLHGDGATTPFIKDASTNNFQIALNGDTKPNNLTPFIPNGYWSNYLASGDSLGLSSSVSQGSTWTIECWYNLSASGNNIISYQSSGGDFWFGIYANTIYYSYGANSRTFSFTSAVNTWYHIALVNNAGSLTCYVNGTQVGTTQTGPSSSTLNKLGGYQAGYYFAGYISNFRVTNTAVYTGSFTPSTTPLTAISGTQLLTCQSNRFVDNSASPYTLTPAGSPSVSMQQPFTAPSGTSQYGSGYFDGTGDAIYSASQATTFGTGDFTLEFWVYFSAVNNSTVKYLYDMRNSGATTASFLAQEASNAWTFWNGAGSTLTTGFTSSTFAATTWNHVAICRSSGVTKFFVNGTQTGSVADTSNYANSTLTVGTRYTFSDGLNGYISNLRIVNGTAVYTAAFTPSTTPLTAVTNTSLLTLQTNGPENNNGFLDSSYNSFPITRNGNTTQGSFTPYEANGYWSVNFTGAQTSPSLTYPSISAYDLGATSQWTYECWVYFASLSGEQSIFERWSGTGGPGWLLTKLSSNAYRAHFGSSVSIDTGAIAVANQWIHLAVSRDGSTGSLFVDGVRQATTGSVANFSDGTDPLVFGERNSGSQTFPFNGYISNARIVKGTYVYNPSSTSITVPTSPLTAITNTVFLGLQSNRYVDNSSNNATATASSASSVQAFQPFAPTVQYTPSTLGGSGYFDGSGDYLTAPTNQAFNFTGDATCECWIYPNALSTNSQLFGFNDGVSDLKWIGVLLNTSGAVSGAATAGAGGSFTSASGVVGVGRWHHIAWVKNGATVYLYVNGVQVASGASSAVYAYQASPLLIGRLDGNNSLCFNGYMTDMRIVKTAVYTSAFTPPTAPLTPVTNTQLLLSMNNAAIFDNSGMGNLETVGNAQIDTSVVKYGTGSMLFDGNGDNLSGPTTPNLNMGTGNWTIECWVYILSRTLNYPLIFGNNNGSYTTGALALVNSNADSASYNDRFCLSVKDHLNAPTLVASSTNSSNTWYHLAVVRNGTSLVMYRDGTSVASATISSGLGFDWGKLGSRIGGGNWDGAQSYFNGYMDDLRITKGVARYVTNFTPPVARMPNQ